MGENDNMTDAPLVMSERLEGSVGLVTINRPKRMNALNMAVKTELKDALIKADNDSSIAVIVLTGGGNAFVAGTDIAEMKDMTSQRHAELGTNDVFIALRACAKPVIAAVEGYALGGGCELALNCDMVVAGKGARFGQPEIRVGIMPGAGGTQLLLRAVGRAKAMAMCLTGEQISGEEAERIGLVSEVVPDGEAVERAIDLGRTIATMPPLAVQSVKAAFRFGQNASLDEALHEERRLFADLFDTTDQTEGMTAFLEKRRPVYSGR